MQYSGPRDAPKQMAHNYTQQNSRSKKRTKEPMLASVSDVPLGGRRDGRLG